MHPLCATNFRARLLIFLLGNWVVYIQYIWVKFTGFISRALDYQLLDIYVHGEYAVSPLPQLAN